MPPPPPGAALAVATPPKANAPRLPPADPAEVLVWEMHARLAPEASSRATEVTGAAGG